MLTENALDAGVAFIYATAEGIEVNGSLRVHTDDGTTATSAVIVATEISALGLSEEAELQGRGLSACASCDAPLHVGKEVVVIGGGDSGALEALALAAYAKRVILVYREPDLHCRAELSRRLDACRAVELRPATTVVGLLADQGMLKALELDTGGARCELPTSAVFSYPGLTPAADLLGGRLPLDERGYTVVDEQMGAGQRGVYVAGDVVAGTDKSLSSAIDSGRRSAQAAIDELSRR
jgi:thioredoxin reductase (NADPH)